MALNNAARKALEKEAARLEVEINRLKGVQSTQQSAVNETSAALNAAREDLAGVVETLKPEPVNG